MSEDQILKALNRLEDRVESIRLKLGASIPETLSVKDLPNLTVEQKILDTAILEKHLGLASVDALASELALRFQSWKYEWSCGLFSVCDTTYEGRVFVIRKNTGEVIRWNLMESATKKDLGLPFWSTSPYYQHARDTQDVRFGFGNEDGRTRHVSTCINCYANWGSISFRWDSSA